MKLSNILNDLKNIRINPKPSKAERSLLLLVTASGAFEWFEFFLFIYWTKIFEANHEFSELYTSLQELIYAIILIFSGLLARPLGGVLFGIIDDKFGRVTAFTYSIAIITLPSAILTISPSFPTWAYSSLIYLSIMRLLQGIPVGGELPAALCLLYEGAERKRRRYLCSYLFVGPQTGQILSLILIIILKNNLTNEELLSWGWRLSFGISTILGAVWALFRKKMFDRHIHETRSFKHLETHRKLEHRSLIRNLKKHKNKIITVLFLSFFEVTGFYLIYYYIFENPELLNLNPSYSNTIYLLYLTGLTIFMPILGSIKNSFKIVSLFKKGALGVILISILFYIAIEFKWPTYFSFILLTIMILLYCIQFSFLPSFIASLFAKEVRFLGIGFSFNVTDGVVGGIISFLALWLSDTSGHSGAFLMLLPITAVIFLICLELIRRRKYSLW